MIFPSRPAFFRVSRFRLSGGDDVKPRWTLPSKDYLKYTYQPSIPDKHFMGAHWNYAPATMWLRHYRPLMEEIATAGWKTASDIGKIFTRPISKLSKSHIPGVGHKVIAFLVGWAAFSYVATSTYGSKMEAWALLDKLHSFSQGHHLGEEGFWNTEEMDREQREKSSTETLDRLERLWQSAIEEATQSRSFQVLCNKLQVSQDIPSLDVPEPVTWRFGLVPFDSVDAHTFPDADRKDCAIEVKPAHESSSDSHRDTAGHGKLIAKQAREIYESAVCATAVHH